MAVQAAAARDKRILARNPKSVLVFRFYFLYSEMSRLWSQKQNAKACSKNICYSENVRLLPSSRFKARRIFGPPWKRPVGVPDGAVYDLPGSFTAQGDFK